MKKIKVYSVCAQSGNDTAAKGSASNPYTQKEYETMLDNDTWPGGYVEGLGYCLKGVTVTASSSNSGSGGSSSMFDYWSSMDSDPWNSNPMDYISSMSPSETGKESGCGTGKNNSGQGGGNGNHRGNDCNTYPQISKTIKGYSGGWKLVENIGFKTGFDYQYSVKITGFSMYISASVYPINFSDRVFWATVSINNGTQKELKLDTNDYAVGSSWIPIGFIEIDLPKYGNVIVNLHIGHNHNTGAGHTNDAITIPIYPFKQEHNE